MDELVASIKSEWDKPLWRRLPLTLRAWWTHSRPRPLVELKQFYQRGRYGVSNHDMWDYFSYHARQMVRVCDRYLELQHGHPCLGHFTDWDAYWTEHGHEPCQDCDCFEVYMADIRAMRDGFQLIVDDDIYDESAGYNQRPEVTKALDLYREHYFSMWI